MTQTLTTSNIISDLQEYIMSNTTWFDSGEHFQEAGQPETEANQGSSFPAESERH